MSSIVKVCRPTNTIIPTMLKSLSKDFTGSIKFAILAFCKVLYFEPSDNLTAEKVNSYCTLVLDSIKEIKNYTIVCIPDRTTISVVIKIEKDHYIKIDIPLSTYQNEL